MPSDIEVRASEATRAGLVVHAVVPIAYVVRARFDPATGQDHPVDPPWVKDYDARSPPLSWADEHDIANWSILTAHRDRRVVGGAVLAWRTPGVDLLDRRDDRVVVWDLRVAPHARGTGVGRAIWQAIERWARAHEAREIRVETQDVNAPACHFYAAMGCTAAHVEADVYRDFPDELQILWHRDLR